MQIDEHVHIFAFVYARLQLIVVDIETHFHTLSSKAFMAGLWKVLSTIRLFLFPIIQSLNNRLGIERKSNFGIFDRSITLSQFQLRTQEVLVVTKRCWMKYSVKAKSMYLGAP